MTATRSLGRSMARTIASGLSVKNTAYFDIAAYPFHQPSDTQRDVAGAVGRPRGGDQDVGDRRGLVAVAAKPPRLVVDHHAKSHPCTYLGHSGGDNGDGGDGNGGGQGGGQGGGSGDSGRIGESGSIEWTDLTRLSLLADCWSGGCRSLPSWTQRAPQSEQKAHRWRLMTVICADAHRGQRGMGPPGWAGSVTTSGRRRPVEACVGRRHLGGGSGGRRRRRGRWGGTAAASLARNPPSSWMVLISGAGNTTVVFLSTPISTRLCRLRSCRASGWAIMMSEAAPSWSAASDSPSAAMILARF